MTARNRALEGDVVAVLLAPRDKWKPMLLDAERDGVALPAHAADMPLDYLQPTGHVVGIVTTQPDRVHVGTFRIGVCAVGPLCRG